MVFVLVSFCFPSVGVLRERGVSNRLKSAALITWQDTSVFIGTENRVRVPNDNAPSENAIPQTKRPKCEFHKPASCVWLLPKQSIHLEQEMQFVVFVLLSDVLYGTRISAYSPGCLSASRDQCASTISVQNACEVSVVVHGRSSRTVLRSEFSLQTSTLRQLKRRAPSHHVVT